MPKTKKEIYEEVEKEILHHCKDEIYYSEEEIISLKKLLKEAEQKLDKCSHIYSDLDELCIFCKSHSFDSKKDEIIHKNNCLIKRIKKKLEKKAIIEEKNLLNEEIGLSKKESIFNFLSLFFLFLVILSGFALLLFLFVGFVKNV